MGAGNHDTRQWRDRRGISWALRALVLLVPLAAAIVTSSFLSRVLPTPFSARAALFWWITVLGGATLVMHFTDRLARKLLPLAVLMRLSLIFPDRAPSRLAVLRKAGSINRLAEAMEEARSTGEDDLALAAERILALAARMNVHDRRTRGHAERVRAYTDLVAEELDLPQDDKDRLRWAALLHDIGKLEVHPDILNKPGKPNDEEWEILRSHPGWGAEIVSPLAGWLGDWVLAVGEHHEKYDGTGYPNGLAGEQISLAARVVAVSDVFDVLTSARSYKKPTSPSAARDELIRCAGTHFDPLVVRAFMNVSVGRLRWVMGPLSWLAELPFIGGLARLARDIAMFGGTAAAVATLAFAGIITPPAASSEAVAAEEPPASTATTSATTVVTTLPTTTTTAVSSTTTTPLPTSNVPPRAFDDFVVTDEDVAVAISVTANDSDRNGDLLEVVEFDPATPVGGIVDCDATICTYHPPAEFSGSDAFTYVVTDGSEFTASATVRISVTAVNDSPLAVDDEESASVDGSVIVYVLANDSDAEGESRTIVAFDTESTNGGSVSCGTFCVYVAPAGFSGVDSFSYTIEDEAGNPATGTVTITVG